MENSNLDKKIKLIKLARMKPEERFLYELMSNVIIKDSELSIIYEINKNNTFIINKLTKNLIIEDGTIYRTLFWKYRLNEKNIRNLLCKIFKDKYDVDINYVVHY